MKHKIEYTDNREQVIKDNADKFLVEEHNLFSGNFLIFETEKPAPVVVYKDVPQKEMDELTQAVLDLTEIVLGGM
jgi:hypothetical protein